ncbi:hypothetical protein ACH4E7_13865 [Kitasatospora sp. NPDC018058]|uniref:hypothetical protein n=1 Tax=Kitasatospora sp. NPDC018058 TaxID=3364025 RepID=UPI0037BEB398
MTDDPSRVVLERLRAVEWSDWDGALAHTRSRAALMREYLRRSALWADAFDAADLWPFFDIAQHIDPAVRADPDIATDLEAYLSGAVRRRTIRETCRGAVHWPTFRRETKVALPGLPDPYDPLLLLYERGGGFYVEEHIDLDGISVPLGQLSGHLSHTPITNLDLATLEALDTA